MNEYDRGYVSGEMKAAVVLTIVAVIFFILSLTEVSDAAYPGITIGLTISFYLDLRDRIKRSSRREES